MGRTLCSDSELDCEKDKELLRISFVSCIVLDILRGNERCHRPQYGLEIDMNEMGGVFAAFERLVLVLRVWQNTNKQLFFTKISMIPKI